MSDTDKNTAAGDKPETRCNWAVVVPPANEEAELPEFVSVLAGYTVLSLSGVAPIPHTKATAPSTPK